MTTRSKLPNAFPKPGRFISASAYEDLVAAYPGWDDAVIVVDPKSNYPAFTPAMEGVLSQYDPQSVTMVIQTVHNQRQHAPFGKTIQELTAMNNSAEMKNNVVNNAATLASSLVVPNGNSREGIRAEMIIKKTFFLVFLRMLLDLDAQGIRKNAVNGNQKADISDAYKVAFRNIDAATNVPKDVSKKVPMMAADAENVAVNNENTLTAVSELDAVGYSADANVIEEPETAVEEPETTVDAENMPAVGAEEFTEGGSASSLITQTGLPSKDTVDFFVNADGTAVTKEEQETVNIRNDEMARIPNNVSPVVDVAEPDVAGSAAVIDHLVNAELSRKRKQDAEMETAAIWAQAQVLMENINKLVRNF
jgi:hypothetical protein